MVVLRLKRFGRTHRPYYRLCAMDRRSPRNGKVIEELGWFNPHAADDQQLGLNLDRVHYWLSVGAQPSDTAKSLIKKAGGNPKSGQKLETSKA